MTKTIATLAATMIAATALTMTTAGAHTEPRWQACIQEDGPGPCVWDAKNRGNGEGRSLLITKRGNIVFIPHSAAHQLLEG